MVSAVTAFIEWATAVAVREGVALAGESQIVAKLLATSIVLPHSTCRDFSYCSNKVFYLANYISLLTFRGCLVHLLVGCQTIVSNLDQPLCELL